MGTTAQAQETARAARLAEFSAMVNLAQETAPESLNLLTQAFRAMYSSPESSWVAVSGLVPNLFTPEERLELVEEKLPVVTLAAAAAVASVQGIRSNLLLEIRTLFHANRGAKFGQFDFSVETDTFETALISLASAVQVLNAKITVFNKIRFEQSSPSDGSSGPSSSAPDSSPAPPHIPPQVPGPQASTSIPPPAATTTTGISAPIAGSLGRGRGAPLKPKSQGSSSGRTRDGFGRPTPPSSSGRHDDGSLF